MRLDVEADCAVSREFHGYLFSIKEVFDGIAASRNLCAIEGMLRDANGSIHREITKVSDHQSHHAIAVSQIGILAMGVERVLIDVHQVKEITLC